MNILGSRAGRGRGNNGIQSSIPCYILYNERADCCGERDDLRFDVFFFFFFFFRFYFDELGSINTSSFVCQPSFQRRGNTYRERDLSRGFFFYIRWGKDGLTKGD